MKIEWEIEGAGCGYDQCGLKTRIVEIPDNEVPEEGPARDNFIDDWIDEKFRREVYFVWKIKQ